MKSPVNSLALLGALSVLGTVPKALAEAPRVPLKWISPSGPARSLGSRAASKA